MSIMADIIINIVCEPHSDANLLSWHRAWELVPLS